MARTFLTIAFIALSSTTTLATERVERSLLRVTPPVDPDARGRMALERRRNGDQVFAITIENVVPVSEIYSLWLEDFAGASTFTMVGNFLPDDATRATLMRDTGRGDMLPFDVMELAELVDRAVQVRDGQQSAILTGIVPTLDSPAGSGGNFPKTRRDRHFLRSPLSNVFPRARGRITAEREGYDSRLVVETRRWDILSTPSTLFIEDEFGALQSIAELQPIPDRYNGYLAWSTIEGEPLPLGVNDVTELAGRRVEIRDMFSAVLVIGEIPDLLTAAGNRRSHSNLDPTAHGLAIQARGSVRGRWIPDRGRFMLDVDARAWTEDENVSLYMENPTTHSLELVQRVEWFGNKRSRRAQWRWRADQGSPLPFGLTDATELLGAAIEIRDAMGQVLLHGTL